MLPEINTFLDYQTLAHTTANNDLDASTALAVATLGLSGESGEVADLIKKHIGHGHQLDVQKVEKELGDVLWYVAEMCTLLKIPMRRVAQKNIEKLAARYPEGFSVHNSINRSCNDD